MNKNHKTSSKIESPCVRNCCLDDKDICLGCFRHLDEITGWTAASDEAKIEILKRCKRRRKANIFNKFFH